MKMLSLLFFGMSFTSYTAMIESGKEVYWGVSSFGRAYKLEREQPEIFKSSKDISVPCLEGDGKTVSLLLKGTNYIDHRIKINNSSTPISILREVDKTDITSWAKPRKDAEEGEIKKFKQNLIFLRYFYDPMNDTVILQTKNNDARDLHLYIVENDEIIQMSPGKIFTAINYHLVKQQSSNQPVVGEQCYSNIFSLEQLADAIAILTTFDASKENIFNACLQYDRIKEHSSELVVEGNDEVCQKIAQALLETHRASVSNGNNASGLVMAIQFKRSDMDQLKQELAMLTQQLASQSEPKQEFTLPTSTQPQQVPAAAPSGEPAVKHHEPQEERPAQLQQLMPNGDLEAQTPKEPMPTFWDRVTSAVSTVWSAITYPVRTIWGWVTGK